MVSTLARSPAPVARDVRSTPRFIGWVTSSKPGLLAARLAGSGPPPGARFAPVVRLLYEHGSGAFTQGSGFVVAKWPLCVVTCAHLFWHADSPRAVTIDCPELGRGVMRALSFAAYKEGAGPDLAVVVFPQRIPVDNAYVPAATSSHFHGKIRGYIAGHQAPTQVEIEASAPAFHRIRYKSSTAEGMSGSPILQQDRLVLGIHLGKKASTGMEEAGAVQDPAWNECMLAAYAAIKET